MVASAALLVPLAIGTAPAQSHTPPALHDSANLPASSNDAWLGWPAIGGWPDRAGDDGAGDSSHGDGHGHCIGVGHHHHGRGHGFGHDFGHSHDCTPPPPPPKPVPTAEFTFSPAVPVATRSVQFDAASSTGGVDGNVTGTIVSYAWDFGDTSSASIVNPAHSFTGAGDYSVSLTVTNDYGQSGTVTHGVHVVAPPMPVAAFTYTPGAPVAGSAVQFDGSTSSGGVTSDPTGNVTGTIVSYAWDFGDTSSASIVNPAHGFAAAGDYSVSLRVTNDYGQSASVTHSVHVVAPPVPVAAFTYTPGAPVAGRAVQFDASTSSGGVTSDPTGDVTGTIVSYAWDFGDTSSGTGVSTAHSFTAAGDFSIGLTVTNDYGQTGTVTHSVLVVAPPVPVAAFTYTPGAPVAGKSVQFDASTSSGGFTSDPTGNVTGTIVSYAWDFGDTSSATGVGAAHAFAAAGDFTVGLTVTNDYGQSSSTTQTLHVVPPPPPYPGGGTGPIVAGASAFSRVSPSSTTTVVRSGRRVGINATVGFTLPARAGENVACAGDVTVTGTLPGAGRIATAAALHKRGDRCAASFRLRLQNGLAGKQVKLTFRFAGNDTVAPWRLVRKASV